MPLTEEVAVIAPNQLLVQSLVEQLRVMLGAIARFDAEISTVTQKLPDYALFRALPGAGAALAPRLLVGFGEQRERYQSAAELQKYTGIAPVTERSGKKHWVAGDYDARRSCARHSSNGRQKRLRGRSGPALTIAATRKRMLTPGRVARLGLQMDTHSVSLLAKPYTL